MEISAYRKWDHSISREHNIALDIAVWIKTNHYAISDLKFEILNREDSKSGYTYVINHYKVNVQVVENHLIEIGIAIQFLDKFSANNDKQYLNVYKYVK